MLEEKSLNDANSRYDSSLTAVDTLRCLSGQMVHFNELTGNNGDMLISNGARHAIERCGVKLCDSRSEASALVITGGAGLSSVWGGAYKEIDAYTTGELSQKPLVILPSTVSIESVDLPGLLSQRTAKTIIFARERMSLERLLKGTWGPKVSIGLDHDMAFHLESSQWLEKLRNRCSDRHILVVERRDAEGLSGASDRAVPLPSGLKKMVPAPFKRSIKSYRHQQLRSNTEFAKWAISTARERLEIDGKLPVKTIDVSLTGLLTFDKFTSLIVESAAIVTTRLHVAILATLLNKPTIVVPGDAAYGKIQGIFEYSLEKSKSTLLVENPFAAGTSSRS